MLASKVYEWGETVVLAASVAVTGFFYGNGMHIHTPFRWFVLGLVLLWAFSAGYLACYRKCEDEGHHNADPRW